jgi:hypothetical protein
MNEVQKPSNSACYTPSSDSFRVYFIERFRPEKVTVAESISKDSPLIMKPENLLHKSIIRPYHWSEECGQLWGPLSLSSKYHGL